MDKTLDDLLDPRMIPDPLDALRAAAAVREVREAAEKLELDAADAAGAAVLRLAARMDTGSRVLNSEREQLRHTIAMALLLGTLRGQELLHEAGWLSKLVLRHDDRLALAYSRFRSWIDSVATDCRVGERRGPRVSLALAAAKAVGATDAGDAVVERLVATHGRKAPVEPGDIPGALLLARAQGASVDGLLRRAPHGLRWVERKARDLVEEALPNSDPVDDATPTVSDPADPAPNPVETTGATDLYDQIAALGDTTDHAILEGLRRGETADDLGQRLGISGRAIRKRRHHIGERAARLVS